MAIRSLRDTYMEHAEGRGRAMTESGDLVLSMGARSLTFRAWSSESELRRFVRLAPDPSYIGEDVEEPTRYYSLGVSSALTATDAFDGLLAIICDRYSIAPTVLPIDS